MTCQTGPDAISTGVVGVSILLLVYFLNLFGFLRMERWPENAVYAALNAVGSGLSAVASGLIRYWPFVVLEGVWCVTSMAGLVRILYRWQRGDYSGVGAATRKQQETDPELVPS